MIKKRGFTIVELTIVIVIFLAMFAALSPFVRLAKKRVNRITCVNNLRKLSLALHSYAADNKERFPASLGALYPEYAADEKVFDCPATRMVGIKDNPNYDYTPGLTESSPAKEVLVRDHDSNHKRAGDNVLRVDGSTEWIPAAR
jgi:prepilin-type N-terminal cleavage/methylation domain-containing protein